MNNEPLEQLNPPSRHPAIHSPLAGNATGRPGATVFVVDDDASFLEAVKRLLRAARFQVKTFMTAEEFLAQLPANAPGCVLMDLEMPGMGGFELQAVLARTGNPLPVIFLTGRGDIRSSVWAMRQGAEDFLTKLAPKEELLAAVANGLARDARERTARARQKELHALFSSLSDREREVLGHVIQGKMNKQIAGDLGISERTVKLHRTAITTKLAVHSVAELTQLWLEAGFAAGK